MTQPMPPETPDTAAWWEATRECRLTVQRCRSCGEHQFYPRSLCRSCHSSEVEMVGASGRGHILSYTVVHRSPAPETFSPPYIVALVALEEGPVLTTNIVDVESASVACDQAVAVRWRALEDGRHLPVFTPTPEEL